MDLIKALIEQGLAYQHWPLAIILAIFIIIGPIIAWRIEKKQWNNGICKDTNEPWKHFDTDSQGGRGYSSGEHHIWVSWPVDKIKETK